jgi:hypothetical protein
MTSSQAKAIVQASKMVGISAQINMVSESECTVFFGDHSTFKFVKYTAARAFILAFEIERSK